MNKPVRHWDNFLRARAHRLSATVVLTLACSGQVTIGVGSPPDGLAGAPHTGIDANAGAGAGDASCQISVKLERAPLDLVLMLDRSLTMNETTPGTGESKWMAVSAALVRFANDPASDGIGVALGFFAAFDSENRVSCDPTVYQDLPLKMGGSNAQAQPLAAAMGSIEFETSSSAAKTPMHVALQGAIAYARDWAAQHLNHQVEVALITDGAPNACDGTFKDVIAAAETGRSVAPTIATRVIAIRDPNAVDSRTTTLEEQLSNLQRVAVAGGTAQAQIVDTTLSTSMQDQFVAAMNAIRQAHSTTCRFALPLEWKPSASASQFSLRVGTRENIPRRSAQECGTEDGYFLDSESSPRAVVLCDSTCASAAADQNLTPVLATKCNASAPGSD